VPVRGVFFDAGDVLYYRPQSTEVYMSGLLRRRGHRVDLSGAERERQKADRGLAFVGCISPEEYWDRLLALHGVADPVERRVLAGLIDAHADEVAEIYGAREALAGLKQRGFLLGIVTDTMHPPDRKRRWLERVGVAEFVDVLVCSSALGVRKPDSTIYLSALHKAGLTPAESAFVGHAAHELEGARQTGLLTVAVNYQLGTPADYYAASLLDLLNVPIFREPRTPKGEIMNHDIEVIFIDVGATLRYLVEDEPYQARARQQIAFLVGVEESPDAFCERLDARYKVYRKWAFETLREVCERDLWTHWMLPELPPERIAPLASELTYLYRQTMGHRHAQPDAKNVVIELARRGYRLGILSNTITEREIPEWLEQDGLREYFSPVVLSSIFGHRKPGPEIFWEAARQARVEPAQAAYVADNPSRDVPGSRRAGFGMMIIMGEPDDLAKKDLTGENKPDLVIRTLSDLLDIFPPRQAAHAKQ